MAQTPPRRSRRVRGGGPDPVDVHVGARIRLRREMLGISQGALAAILGITFQQVQKYERGANRVGASRLYRIAKALDIRTAFFFEDGDLAAAPGFAEPAAASFDMDPFRRRETVELVNAYFELTDPVLRRHFLDLARRLAARDGNVSGARPRQRSRRIDRA